MSEQWEKLKDLFEAALNLSGKDREDYLRGISSEHPTLYSSLKNLIEQHEAAGTFLQGDNTIALSTFAPGQMVAGRYRVARQLGRGGMGEVYEAFDTTLNEEIALKTLREDATIDSTVVAYLIQELQVARKVTHPGVCRVHDVGRHTEAGEEIIFFTMELLHGETLAGRIRREGRLAPDAALAIAKQIADGIDAAHASGIVHRDLKPSNIMLTESGRVVIMDFGLARDNEQSPPGFPTREGRVFGTPGYISPEQVAGGRATPASDIYAFGVVLHEMLTGRKPTDETNPISTFDLDADPVWNSVILKCLEPRPEKRFQRAADIIRAVEQPQPERRSSLAKVNNRWVKNLVAIVILLAAALGVWRVMLPPASKPVQPNSILVLPFESHGQEANDDYFADGLTDELIASLSRDNVRVLARDSAFRVNSKGLDLRQIYDELHVNYVVRGDVRWFGDRLRLIVHVIHAPDGETKSQQYERQKGDIFALQDDLTKTVTSELQVHLSGLSSQTLRRGTQSQEVYELYLKGRYYWNKRDLESILRAQSLFEEAIKKDPKYAEAYVGVADCINLLPGLVDTPAPELFSKAKEAALTALSLDPALADAYTTLGFIAQRQDWDWELAGGLFRRALNLDPGSVGAHQRLGSLLSDIGQNDLALQEYEKARSIDPLNVQLNSAMGINYFYARRYDEAIRQLTRTLELDPNFARPYIFIGDSYIQKGMPQQALQAYEKGVDLTHRDLRWLVALIYGYAKAGKRNEALDLINGELNERVNVQKEPFSPFYLAMPYAGVGDYEKALLLLEKGLAEHVPEMTSIQSFPHFDALHADSRYKNIIAKMRL